MFVELVGNNSVLLIFNNHNMTNLVMPAHRKAHK